jgi:Fe2+ transport system protein B
MNDISDAQRILKEKQQEAESFMEENLEHLNEKEVYSARIKLILFWSFVGIPLFWGVMQTFDKAMQLFK